MRGDFNETYALDLDRIAVKCVYHSFLITNQPRVDIRFFFTIRLLNRNNRFFFVYFQKLKTESNSVKIEILKPNLIRLFRFGDRINQIFKKKYFFM